MSRIAIVYDDTLRPETTGIYCRRALEELQRLGRVTAVEHVLPAALEHVTGCRFDLFVFIDDGLELDWPDELRPAVWWAIDTHIDFERSLRRARRADVTFAAQKNGTERLRQAGISTARWLPLACDPELHGRRLVEPQYDVAFVGHEVGEERRRLLELIRREYPRCFLGQCRFNEMSGVYSASKIVFNRSVADDVNMRVFEGLCSGALLVTNRVDENGLAELFEDGRHLVTYGCDEELLDKLKYYLSADSARARIAEVGRDEVVARHTYRLRLERLLDEIGATGHGGCRVAVATKPTDYFEFERPDVLALIPHTAQRILDVGCGCGRLGTLVKSRQPAEVVGIELNPDAAERAQRVLDAVHVLDVESAAASFHEETFDCVVCADVLEHLRDPSGALANVRRWLALGGTLVTSIPNVRHYSVVQALLAGNWTYESAGLLDADHVRFFTRREIEKLLYRTGFAIEEMRMVPGLGYDEWVRQGKPKELRIGGLQVHAGSSEEAVEFFAYQYLTRARKIGRPDYGLTSIIIVTYNQLGCTRQCVDSIRMRTDEPYELVFVDNGSRDGTPAYLDSIPNAVVIHNAENRGFPAAANQGLQAASGRNLLLLNNDVVVTTGWLHRQLEVLHTASDVGLVGPVSNNVSGAQRVPAGYESLTDLDGYAWDWSQTHTGEIVETDRLVGFCLLMKREVLDAIGLLDERFGIGNFEDDDFCRRALDAGYRVVIARGAFIHHIGSATFRGSGVDLRAVLDDNRRLYEQKWGMEPRRNGRHQTGSGAKPANARGPRPTYRATAGDGPGLILQPNDLRLSACLIVRDNVATIRPCLESLRPWVDEIVVVDTGSTDPTPAICRDLGARVFHWAWQDDFAAARNESLRHALGEWIFWMDSDDTLPEECGRQLRTLVDGDHPDQVFGYIAQVHCPGANPDDLTVVDHVKLFRNRPDLERPDKTDLGMML